MKKLDHKKMIEAVDKILQENNDFLFDMECKYLPKQKPYTQKEAKQMEDILGRIYMIAHCLYCEPCQVKHIKDETNSPEA